MLHNIQITSPETSKIRPLFVVTRERLPLIFRYCFDLRFYLVSELDTSPLQMREHSNWADHCLRDLFQGLALLVLLHPFIDHFLRHLPDMFCPVPSLNTILLQVPEYHRLARLRIRILQPVDSGDLHRGESLREVKLFKLLLLRGPCSPDLFAPRIRSALFHLTLHRLRAFSHPGGLGSRITSSLIKGGLSEILWSRRIRGCTYSLLRCFRCESFSGFHSTSERR